MVKEYTVFVFDCLVVFEKTRLYSCIQTLKKFVNTPISFNDIETMKLNILIDVKKYTGLALDITEVDFEIQLVNRFYYPEFQLKEENFNENCKCCF